MSLKLAALVQASAPPHLAWRIIRPFCRMQRAGIDARLVWAERLADLELPAGLDVLVLPSITCREEDRELMAGWAADLRARGVLLVFECDDDLFSESYYGHMRQRYVDLDAPPDSVDYFLDRLRVEHEGMLWVLRHCDGATVSSEPLAELLRTYTDRPVIVVPNALDVEAFRAGLVERPPWADHLTIGWAGWRRPERDLAPMAEAWGRIAGRYPDVRFVVAGWQPDVIYRHVPHERIIAVGWQTIETYPSGMQVDIGCCAVADLPFNRCKTPIKAWEYALAGAAVVATPTLYGEEAARKAETVDEWERALAVLVTDPVVRQNYQCVEARRVLSWHDLDGQYTRWPAAYAAIGAARMVLV